MDYKRNKRDRKVSAYRKSWGQQNFKFQSFKKGKNGTLILSPSKKVPDTMEELFKNWHGKYQTPDDLKDWDNAKPVGEELW